MRLLKIFLPLLLLFLFSLCPLLPNQTSQGPTAIESTAVLPTTAEPISLTPTNVTATAPHPEVLPSPTPTAPEGLPSPTTEPLIPGDLQGITIENIHKLTIIGEIPYPEVQPDHIIFHLQPSNDGTKLVILSQDWETRKIAMVVWDLTTNAQLFAVEDPPHFIQSVSFTPDDQKLWVFAFDAINQYDLQSGQVQNSITFSATDKALVSSDGEYYIRGKYLGDPNTSTIELFSMESNTPNFKDEMAYMIMSFRFSPDSKMVAGNSAMIGASLIKIWDVKTGAGMTSFYNYDSRPTFSWDSTLVALSRGNQFSIFSTETWVLKKSFTNDNLASTNYPAFFLAGDQILAIQQTASVTFNDVNTGEELLELPGQVTIVNYAPSRNVIFTNTNLENIKLWGILP